MSYLKEFLKQIHLKDFQKFLVLWEEYTMGDSVEFEEFRQLLKILIESDMARPCGQIIEKAIPLWQTIKDKEESYEILRLLIDLETTQTTTLAEIALNAVQKKYGSEQKFNDWLKMSGLREKENFQGALSKFDLLAHMKKGFFVFHTGGWGVGEIIDVSFVREQLIIEFENTGGKKDVSFANAFKTLTPLPKTHFLARRFSDADRFEAEGMEDSLNLVKTLLRDLGPKSASEIKDELCGLVINEKNWTKWWQGARAKLKKDPYIETPDSLKQPFYLRQSQILPEDKLKKALEETSEISEIIQIAYSFVRDTPTSLKDETTKEFLQSKLKNLLESPQITEEQKLEVYLLLEHFFADATANKKIKEIIANHSNVEKVIQGIEIIAFKKRALITLKECRADWIPLYLDLLSSLSQIPLRDFILKELNQGEAQPLLIKKLQNLLDKPHTSPELFVWYFNKVVSDDDELLPLKGETGKHDFFEAFFILMYAIENQVEYRDLLKKMYNLMTNNRYALVRQLLQGTSLPFAKEFLLLCSKCQSLSDHDKTILRSLVEVVHPSIALPKKQKEEGDEEGEIWTTEAGYLKIQERIRQIGTVEVVENAREIEAARALGDLRENSEFKFAQERRARLQSELKTLSDQLSRSRIITPEDINPNEIGIGNEVEIKDLKGKKFRYLILGPWDANTEENILSFNSKFAQAMSGKKVGESFDFREDKFEIESIKSLF